MLLITALKYFPALVDLYIFNQTMRRLLWKLHIMLAQSGNHVPLLLLLLLILLYSTNM